MESDPNEDLDDAELAEAMKARKKEIRDEQNDTHLRVRATIVNSMGPYGQKQIGIGPARLFTDQNVTVVDRRLRALTRLVNVAAVGKHGQLESAIVDTYIQRESHPMNNPLTRRVEEQWDMVHAVIQTPSPTLVGTRLQRAFYLAAQRPPWPAIRTVTATAKALALSDIDLLLEEEMGLRLLGIVILSPDTIAAVGQWDTNDIQAAFALVLKSGAPHAWGAPLDVRVLRVLKQGDATAALWWYVGWTLVDPEVRAGLIQ